MKQLAITVLLLIVVRACIGETGCVPSSSMEPTLLSGDCIWIDKITYGARLPARWSDIPILNIFTWIKPLRVKDQAINWGYGRLPGLLKPVAGDVVVFNSPENRQKLLVKRITRLLHAGDTLHLSPENYEQYKNIFALYGKTLYKRGANLYINEKVDSVYVLPENYYFMEGDNKINSSDSRTFGYIPERYIAGKVNLALFSLDPDGLYRIRFNRVVTSVK